MGFDSLLGPGLGLNDQIPPAPPAAPPSTGAIFIPRLYGTNYSIWLSTPTGQKVLLIDRFNRLQYTLSVNGIGVLKLDLPPSFPLSYVQEDSWLEVYRHVPGGKKYRDGDAVWLIRDWDEIINQQGQESITLLAYTATEILDRAITAYAANTSQATKAGLLADNLIKALVRENLGSLATDAARDKSTYLVVESDTGAGPSTSKSAAWRKLLPTLRDVAQDSDELGTPVFFDVIRKNGESSLSFFTTTGQRGIDHSTNSSSAKKVILSTRNGTLGEVRRSYISSTERNFIYVGGSDTGTNRVVVTASSPTRTALSPFNRREIFVESRNESDPAVLETEAKAALKNYRPREVLSAKIRDSNAIKYGRDYDFGGRFVAEIKSRAVNVRLDAVEVLVDRGAESIRAELRVDQ